MCPRNASGVVLSEKMALVDKEHADTSTTKPETQDFSEPTVIEKLFTSKEERHIYHAHKILGFSALASFAYRFAFATQDCRFGPHIGTLVFIIHHFALSSSSFVFKIPQRRIKDGGFRIWPEYRIHSLVFASRSLACMLLNWVEQRYGLEEQYYWINTLIVLLGCAAADYGSSLQGQYRSNTVRGTTYTDPYGHWFASEMQFNLTAICLVGIRRYSLHMTAVFIIQCNSFLMTLRRKNVASHEVLTAAYGVLLLLGRYMAVKDMMLPCWALANVGVILRMGPLHLDKYVLWTGLGILVHCIRSFEWVEVENNLFWCLTYVVTKCIVIGLGLRKRSQQIKPGQQDAKEVYVILASQAALFAHIYYKYFVQEGWSLLQ